MKFIRVVKKIKDDEDLVGEIKSTLVLVGLIVIVLCIAPVNAGVYL